MPAGVSKLMIGSWHTDGCDAEAGASRRNGSRSGIPALKLVRRGEQNKNKNA